VRTRLDPSGKIYPPDSISHARERLLTLDTEIGHIQDQLHGPQRLYPTLWREQALHKIGEFKSERRQTIAWIAAQERNLFRDAVKLLCTLRDEDVTLSTEEAALITRCEAEIARMDEEDKNRKS
jgi:hypothetical protein